MSRKRYCRFFQIFVKIEIGIFPFLDKGWHIKGFITITEKYLRLYFLKKILERFLDKRRRNVIV